MRTPTHGQTLDRSEATGPKITSLDGLRGLAVLAVMFHHSVSPYSSGTLVSKVIHKGLFLGWIGVDLFFVLSGFLITGILLNTRNCRNYFSSFWCRRALRIFPLSYGFLLVALLIFPHIVDPHSLPLKVDYWLYPTYLMNWLPLWHEHWHGNILGHFWSLCIEEQFYLVWPLLVLVLNPRTLPSVLVVLELLMVIGRGWWVWHYGPNEFMERATITKADSLLAGALCACVIVQRQIPRRTTSMLAFMAAILFGGFVAVYGVLGEDQWLTFLQAGGFTILALSFSALLIHVVQTDKESGWLQAVLQCRPLTSIGKIAYGVYIFHVPVFYFVDVIKLPLPPDIPSAGFLRLLLKFLVTLGVAYLSYTYFERPFLLLKDRFKPDCFPVPQSGTLAKTTT